MEMSNKMSNNETRKAALLITEASRLGRDVSGYGMCDVNSSSGNVYLWLEDYQVTLFIGCCDGDDVRYNWSCGYCGAEFEFDGELPSENELEEWVESLQRNDGEHCEECETED